MKKDILIDILLDLILLPILCLLIGLLKTINYLEKPKSKINK